MWILTESKFIPGILSCISRLSLQLLACCLYYMWQLFCRLYEGRIAQGPSKGTPVVFKVIIDVFMFFMYEIC